MATPLDDFQMQPEYAALLKKQMEEAMAIPLLSDEEAEAYWDSFHITFVPEQEEDIHGR